MPDPKTNPHAPAQADATDAAPARRRFLVGAAVAAAAAGTAATAGHLVQPPASGDATAAEPADDKATGYRLTEHIRKYYKTTWI
ncbi:MULTISPECIES: twin-arginine translocation signal domain-containing protein [Ralstonia solanacearum species complex]|uniref:Twin-arginine translocation signal domain-containing protein n=1 Tax=Ralstonia syzygii TaxID=28097 RepID=A0ABX7ZCN4_9RALS|nr:MULTISPECIES: twin-arginine translocation signal domain-containing protein [Ralstonia solanacearum species complex]AMP36916.1 formate dehydrogenase [Ralstonia solanacearum]AXV85725.1 formate dehydrogenase [Ralstonia solanacearum]AXW07363.1 formate dehydrogenase [Ralstonia solanacearum]AXW25149.1 formate dehydrogenase [Ralstonia solanacearum]AXW82060.1 formate dehydrogenase [Ralstonia solanacearum]